MCPVATTQDWNHRFGWQHHVANTGPTSPHSSIKFMHSKTQFFATPIIDAYRKGQESVVQGAKKNLRHAMMFASDHDKRMDVTKTYIVL